MTRLERRRLIWRLRIKDLVITVHRLSAEVSLVDAAVALELRQVGHQLDTLAERLRRS